MYADSISKGLTPDATSLKFYVRAADGDFKIVRVDLDANGSLAPLFLAFGLITPEEAAEFFDVDSLKEVVDADNKDLFEWLSSIAEQAANAGEEHDRLKRLVRLSRQEIEEKYGLASISLGGEFSVGGPALKQQIEALRVLKSALESLSSGRDVHRNIIDGFFGMHLRLYHSDFAPMVTVSFKDLDGTFNIRSEPLRSRITENGTIHLVICDDIQELVYELKRIDLTRAKLLSKVGSFWSRRSRDLASALKNFLKVQNVWFDSRGDSGLRKFVLWAGAVIEYIESSDLMASINISVSYNILVHSDESSPMLEYVASSSLLQVGTDCPPERLVQFMTSTDGVLANKSASLLTDDRAEEEAALNAVKEALGSKAVVRLCSTENRAEVLQAAKKLVDAAPSIRSAIDLTNISIAIDDCYDVWDSGFVSIPYDFSLDDLKPQLRALLEAPGRSDDTISSFVKRGPVAASCLQHHECAHPTSHRKSIPLFLRRMHANETRPLTGLFPRVRSSWSWRP